MRNAISRLGAILIATIAFAPCLGFAQGYPNRVIKIVTSGVGGPSDTMARLIADAISGPLGQSVIVDNRPPLLAYELVSKAPPDGYTIYLAGAYFTTIKLLQSAVTADPVKDFAPITITDEAPCIFVVNPTVPATSMQQLIELARAKPGMLNFGSSAIGTAAYLGAELLKSISNTDFVIITYKTTPEANLSVISGTTQMTMDTATSLVGHIKAGSLRALGVTTAQPSPLAPGVPTMAASGLPGFEMEILGGMYAPAGTPDGIINRLNQEIVRVLKRPEVRQRLLATGTEVVANSPSEAAAMVKADVEKWARVLKGASVQKN